MRTLACLPVLLLALAAMAEEPLPADVEPHHDTSTVDASLRAASSSPTLLDAMNAVLRAPAAERSAAVDALAALSDERTVPLFGYVARYDANLAARSRAAAALGGFTNDEAVALAMRTLEDGRLPTSVREEAAASLGRQAAPAASTTLDRLARDVEEAAPVRDACRGALRASYPELFAALTPPVRVIDRSGRFVGTLTGALSGAYTLGLVGALAPGGDGAAASLGVLGGLVVGGVGANLYARDNGLPSGQAAYLLSAGAWSVPVGVLAGGLTNGPSGDCSGMGCTGVMLLTHAGAMTGAWLTKDRLNPTSTDVTELNLATAAATVMTWGLLKQPEPRADVRLGQAVLALAPVAGFAAGARSMDRMRLTSPLVGLNLLTTTEGVLAGSFFGTAWVPESYATGPLGTLVNNDRRGERITGLALFGGGLGLAGGLWAGTRWDPTMSDVALASFSTVDGHLLGASLPMLLAKDASRSGFAGSAFGGLAGLGLGIGLRGPLDLKLERGDAMLMGLGRAFAVAQGLGWAAVVEERANVKQQRAYGAALLGVGLSGVGLTYAAQRTDLSRWKAAWLFSGGVWGAWLGGWSAYALDTSGVTGLSSALVGADVGLALSGLALSPWAELSPNTLAGASVGGVAGMTLGVMLAVYTGANASSGHGVATANVIGSSVGLVAGGWWAHHHEAQVSKASAALQRLAPELPAVALPTTSVSPATDPRGVVVPGMQAQLSWAL